MLIEDNKKSKSFSVKSIMRNKKMVGMLDEALKSPVGSTKRKQAKSMFSSLLTMKNNNSYIEDGMGGNNPYMTMDPSQQQGQTTGQQMHSAITGAGSKVAGAVGDTLKYAKDMFQTGVEGTIDATRAGMGVVGMPGGTTPTPGLPEGPMSVDEIPQSKAIMRGISIPATGETSPYQTMAPEADLTATLPYGSSQDGINEWAINNPDAFDSWLYDEGISADIPEQFKTLTEAVTAGIGPTAFAYQVMSDRDELKKLFPNVPDEDLPVGASLARQVAELKDTLKEEHKIDQLLNNVTSLTNRNLNVENDLQAYVRGRDEYMGKIDGMLENLKQTTNTMDMSNPNTAKRMKQYSDYLTILKGRQEKRYVDYVQTSVDQADNELTQAQNLYNTQLTAFETALQTEGAITVEDYTTLKTMLSDMYTNLDGQEMKELGKLDAQYGVWESYYNMMESALDSSGNGATDPMKAGEFEYYQRNLGLTSDYEGIPGYIESPDLYGLMDRAGSEGYSGDRMKNAFFEKAQRDAVNSGVTGNTKEYFDFYNQTLESIVGQAVSEGATSWDNMDNTKRTDIANLIEISSNNLSNGLYDFFTDEAEGESRTSQLRDILRDIIGSGPGGAWDPTEEGKSTFIKKHDNKLSRDVTGAIYDSYISNIGFGGIAPSDFFDKKSTDSDMVNTILNDLVSTWRDYQNSTVLDLISS